MAIGADHALAGEQTAQVIWCGRLDHVLGLFVVAITAMRAVHTKYVMRRRRRQQSHSPCVITDSNGSSGACAAMDLFEATKSSLMLMLSALGTPWRYISGCGISLGAAPNERRGVSDTVPASPPQ
jgi:hypothetical protein